jgi:hypothetical protein
MKKNRENSRRAVSARIGIVASNFGFGGPPGAGSVLKIELTD